MGDEYEVDLRNYFRVLWQGKKVIFLIMFISIISSAIFSTLQPTTYQGTTVLEIIEPKELSTLKNPYKTYSRDIVSQIVMSEPILVKLQQELDFEMSTDELKRNLKASLSTYTVSKKIQSLPIITLSVKGDNSDEVKHISETWALLMVREGNPFTKYEETQVFIDDKIKKFESEMTSVENEKQEYLEVQNLSLLKYELKICSKEINILSDRVINMKITHDELNLKLNNLKSQGDSSGEVKAISSNMSLLSDEIGFTKNKIIELHKEINDKQKKIDEINKVIKIYDERINDSYVLLDKLKGERQIITFYQLNNEEYRILEETRVTPIPNKNKMNIIIAGVLGLFVGVFAAFLKNYIEEGKV